MVHFIDDDDGYEAWLVDHPDGFVINTYRRPRASYLRLHRATCSRISGTPANGRRWTTNYVKACGGRDELVHWARNEVGAEPWACPTCM